MNRDDATLLREFVKDRSDSAFAQIVERYLPMVYASAFRQLNGDSGLASDIAQSVFIALAAKAPSLRAGATLAPWLHKATRLAVLSASRSQHRRQLRETEAVAMHKLHDDRPLPWDTLRPLIDDALHHLNDIDREAILLTYFRERPRSELSTLLGCSENAARMRLQRALEKLRKILARQGFDSTTAALAQTLGSHSGIIIPLGLATAITTVSVSAAALSTTSTLGYLAFMTSIKTKTALALLLVATVTTPLLLQRRQINGLRQENAQLRTAVDDLSRARDKSFATSALADPAELARLRAQQVDLARLRGEVTALRQENQSLKAAQPSKPSSQPQPALVADNTAFISAELWANVGFDTPERAFQSFLSVLKTGDAAEIASTVHFDVKWKPEITEEDQKLVEKSKQDYLEMLERARKQLTAFNIATLDEVAPDRQRIVFATVTPDGERHNSSFEMIKIDNQWKPLLSMRWLDGNKNATFATSPVFGPKIDLEQEPIIQ
jgi:RNA polymerase sigma factor (sigma-70 family)